MRVNDLSNLRNDPEDRRSDELERPIDTIAWAVPNDVTVEGGELIWTNYMGWNRGTSEQFATMDFGLLDEFRRLHDAQSKPHTIVAFAKKWGVLEICQHDLPISHSPEYLPLSLRENPDSSNKDCFVRCTHLSRTKVSYTEPLSSWCRFATEVDAMLRIADALKAIRPRPGALEDWERLGKCWGPPETLELLWQERGQHTVNDWDLLTLRLGDWLALGDIRLHTYWDRRLRKLRIGFQSKLFGMLALQLTTVISGSRAIAFCDKCGKFYAPKRRPHQNEPRYCKACGKTEPSRISQQKRRAKKGGLTSIDT